MERKLTKKVMNQLLEVENQLNENELISVLLPARNESKTICSCIEVYNSHPRVGEVIVVANGCDDDTAIIARNSRAQVIETQKIGKGNALMVGAKEAKYPILICIDADTLNPNINTITNLIDSFPGEKRIVKGTFNRELHPGPVTDILVKPILKLTDHPLSRLSQPLSGIFACGTNWFCSLNLPDGFGVDLHTILMAVQMDVEIREVNIGSFEHRKRDWQHYRDMSLSIMEVLLANGLINHYSKNNN